MMLNVANEHFEVLVGSCWFLFLDPVMYFICFLWGASALCKIPWAILTARLPSWRIAGSLQEVAVSTTESCPDKVSEEAAEADP